MPADPEESWKHEDDGSAPALPVTSPAEDKDTAQGAAASAPPPPPSPPLLPPPLPCSAADPQEQTQAWPPHSSFQAQRPAAAGSPGSSVLDDRTAAATAGDLGAPNPAGAAGAGALPTPAGSGVVDSPAASEGAVSTGPATPRKQAAAAVGSAVPALPAAATATDPLWLTFADPALEWAFIAWHARQTQLVRVHCDTAHLPATGLCALPFAVPVILSNFRQILQRVLCLPADYIVAWCHTLRMPWRGTAV